MPTNRPEIQDAIDRSFHDAITHEKTYSINETVDLMCFCPISRSLASSLTSLYEKIYPRNHANGVVPAVNFFAYREVYAYLISNENPIKSTDS